MSGEEYKNYKKSLSYWKRRPAKADSPNAVAQNIRRLQGKDTGVISKWINKDRKNIDFVDLRDRLRAYGMQLKNILEEIAPDSTNKNSAPEELSRILSTLDDLGAPIAKITDKNQAENFSRAELREMRSGLTEYIGNLNKLLFGYYKNDKRIHYQIINLTHFMNDAIVGLDDAYETVSDHEDLGGGDLGTLRQEMTKYGYMISSGDKEAGMTPSLYEAYLQLYKTPREAIRNYSRYIELKEKQDEGGKLSNAETKEFGKLSRIRNLAGDFDRSHRYMLEKDSYSQQDIDYAFDLQKKEKDGAKSPDMNENHLFASNIYQSLFFEKVFGGLKDRFLQASQKNDQKSGSELRRWLDTDMANCVKQKRDEMTKIVRAVIKEIKYPNEENVLSELWFLINSRWINRLFLGDKEEKKRNQLRNAFQKMSYYGTLGEELAPIIRQVISEQPKIVEEEVEEEDQLDDSF